MDRQTKINEIRAAMIGRSGERRGSIRVEFVYYKGAFHLLEYKDQTTTEGAGLDILFYFTYGVNMTAEDLESVREKCKTIDFGKMQIAPNAAELARLRDEYVEHEKEAGRGAWAWTI